ncbi:MAG: ABC transporter permease [Tannerella sp.]|jgi:ABC-type antimicrobial peptide transport system permease subunit|nr:ABC transporter permease [Tannerella sp.]
MIRHYWTVALRNLWKYKSQTLISVIGLAAGFICFSYCSFQLRIRMDMNKGITDIDRICFIYDPETTDREKVSYNRSIAESLEKEFPEIESQVAYINMMPQVGKMCEIPQPDGTNHYFEETFVIADAKFIDFFDIQFIEGSLNDLVKYENGMLLAEKTAMKMFGTVDVTGKTFHNVDDFREDNEVYTIRGVIKDFPKRSYFEQFSGINWHTALTDNMSYGYYVTYVKLKPGTDLNKLNQKLNDHLVRYNKQDEIKEMKVQLKPLRDYGDFVSEGEVSKTARIFFTIGFLVLLTALLNYIVFISGRVLTRIKECGIRKVAGSDRRHLFRLFFSEALAVYLLACMAGFMIIELSSPVFKNISMFGDLDFVYLKKLLAQYSMVGIAVIAVLCLMITYRLIRIPIMQSINAGVVWRQNNFIRNTFLFVQFFICFLFIGGSWFIRQQSILMESVMTAGLSEDDKARIFSINLNGDKLEPARSAVLSGLKRNPKVEAVSRNGMDLFGAWHIRKDRYTWNDISEAEQDGTMTYLVTDANFTDFVKTTPKEGRFFEQGEQDKMVVNESFAKWVKRNPIGMEIGVNYWGNGMQYYQVVGILPDIATNQYEFRAAPVHPCLYIPYPDGYTGLNCYVKVAPGYEKFFPQEMEEELRKYVSPAYEFYIRSLKESASWNISEEQNLFNMTTVFSVICVIITLLGMYAAVVLATEKRKKEVTIRKIHGATPKIIILMFCKNIYLLLGLSACVAFPVVVYLLKKWLSGYAVKIEIGLFPFIFLFLLLAALVTGITIGQILRIARTNPAETLKSE